MVKGRRRQAARCVLSPREEFRMTARPTTSGDAANARRHNRSLMTSDGAVSLEPSSARPSLSPPRIVEKNESETVANSIAAVRPSDDTTP